MKTILCYGDSNTHGTAPMTSFQEQRRLGFTERWPGVLRQTLGADYWVIEEGLGGRTTVWDDPVAGGEAKNGQRYLAPCLLSHKPLDLIILMLGTNDLKARFSVTPQDIALSAGVLLEMIAASQSGPGGAAPQALLICPPRVRETGTFAGIYIGAERKSQEMPRYYREVAQTLGAGFLDAGEVIEPSPIDGVHFDAAEHARLGQAVAQKVRERLG